MKVGVITFHHVDNFGAAWQCYSLCSVLRKLGHQPFLVNYRPAGALLAYRMPKGKYWITPNMLGFFKKKFTFNLFRKKHLPVQTRCFASFDQLKNNSFVADLFIAGSDQIWNPSLSGEAYDPSYFLEFTKSGKRIAYAASFGESQPIDLCADLESMLSKLDSISVRESAARNTLVEAYGIDVDVVCDPAILNEDYGDFLVPDKIPENYVFCYNLFKLKKLDEACAILAGKRGCTVRKVNDDWKFWKYESTPEFGIGPIRWLNRIHKARFVVTDSFHATVFSVLFEKDFVVSLANKDKGKSNRIVSLLTDLGLESKIIADGDTVDDIERRLDAPVDRDAVKDRIRDMRRHSLDYLTGAINNH